MTPALKIDNVTKSFGKNEVLKGISFEVEQGTLHSLVGENGAGKSTLLNIVHGVIPNYGGSVEMFGDPVRFSTPIEAIDAGISKVHQEIQVVPGLTVGENIALGSEKDYGTAGIMRRRKIYERTDQILKRLDCQFNSMTKMSALSVGEIQMVAIAKSLFHDSKIISLDEPTASLSDREAETLFRVIDDLRADGITFIYVSHRLDEVMALSDHITILRDGVQMGTWGRGEISREDMIARMVGRELEAVSYRAADGHEVGDVVLATDNLSGPRFRDVSIHLRQGEIFGLAGLVGSGRTELAETIFGARERSSGVIQMGGVETSINTPADAMRMGIALIPEDRKRAGFVANLDNSQNMYLPLYGKRKQYFVSDSRLVRNFEKYQKLIHIQPPDPRYMTASLSGGNQQKIILAKWLATEAEVLLFDEPTKGIDVGARAEIYKLIRSLAAEGKAIMVISSELPEIIALSDRIGVMREGDYVAEFLNDDTVTEKYILQRAMGDAQ